MRLVALIVTLMSATAQASPNAPLDHPVYEQLAELYALGKLPPYLGGFRPLSVARIKHLLHQAGEVASQPLPSVDESSWWVAPLQYGRLEADVIRDQLRPYSTAARHRDVAGAVAFSCERTEGRPCGGGTALQTDLESAAGYGAYVTGVVRLRAVAGTNQNSSDVAFDRGYVAGKLGPIAVEVGRDSFAVGPASRTQIAWGTHAPTLDHVRVATARPWAAGRSLTLNGQYVVGRLREPQHFSGNLVSIVRAQADIAAATEVGVTQLLQMGGEGAPSLGVLDFVLEHVRRRDLTGTASDSSNRRFGFDVSTRILSLRGLRLYYAVMFEDIRRARWIDAFRYDADHLIGFELAALGSHAITIEWRASGVRSQEHGLRTTGFTNRGRVVGDPLGPAAMSLYLGGRTRVRSAVLYPWAELVTAHSDTYTFVEDGPISPALRGTDEQRYRLGMQARVPITTRAWVEAQAFVETVHDLAFQPGSGRTNAGITAAAIWYPSGRLGSLVSQ